MTGAMCLFAGLPVAGIAGILLLLHVQGALIKTEDKTKTEENPTWKRKRKSKY